MRGTTKTALEELVTMEAIWRTRPDVRHYRIRLLLRVFGVEAVVGIWMQNPGSR